AAKAAGQPLPSDRAKIPKVRHRDPDTGESILVPRGRARTDVLFRRLGESMEEEEFTDILQSTADPRAKRLLELLVSPKHMKWSLPRLAMEAGLSYEDVVLMIRNRNLGTGIIRMSSHAPDVMEDVAIDARSREVACPKCRGDKMVPKVIEETDEKTGKVTFAQAVDPTDGHLVFEKCLACDGAGIIRQIGDADSRKLMFETLKLTGRTAPLVVQQFNQAGSMEDAVASAHDVLDVPILKDSNGSD